MNTILTPLELDNQALSVIHTTPAPLFASKLPPYWRRSANRCGGNPWNGVWIYTGRKKWGHAKSSVENASDRITAMLPPNEPDPRVFRWPVMGLDVMILWDQDVAKITIMTLVSILMKNLAQVVRVIEPAPSFSLLVFRDDKNG